MSISSRPRPLADLSGRRCASASRTCLEALEDRRLLAGLTLITHGFQAFGDRPGWLDSWQDAVAQRVDPTGADASRYEIFIGENSADIGKYDPDTPAIDQTASGEVIVTLDWAERSNDFFLFGDGSGSTTDIIAAEVLPYLTNVFPAIGITAPLAQLPIHLVGHSRGASFAVELARELGERGAWVEQVSLLDPHPLVAGQDAYVDPDEADPPITLTENVYFADNLWREDGDALDVNGEPVDGALNFELDDAILDNGGYSLGHSDTHLFYYGTIDLSLDAQEDGTPVPDGWYPAHGVARDAVGFAYTRIAGGLDDIDSAFVAAPFGGDAARHALVRSGPQWPNVMVDAPGETFYRGERVVLSLRYQDVDSAAAIRAVLDTDRNPFNGDAGTVLGDVNVDPTGDAILTTELNWTVAAGLSGPYYIRAAIDDGGRQRFSYAAETITIVPDQDGQDAAPGGLASDDAPTRILDAPMLPATGFGSFSSRHAALDEPDIRRPLGLVSAGLTMWERFDVDLSRRLDPGAVERFSERALVQV